MSSMGELIKDITSFHCELTDEQYRPLQLPPHNERVVVIIDLDKNEFAFVERKGYAVCIKAGARSIDWSYRDEFIRSRAKKPRSLTE